MAKQTQREYILEQLLAGRRITKLDIFNEKGCMTLNSRIPEIKAMGYDIKDRFVNRTNAQGVTKNFKEYWIEPPAQGTLNV